MGAGLKRGERGWKKVEGDGRRGSKEKEWKCVNEDRRGGKG